MAYTITKKQIKDLNNMNVAAQDWAGVGLGTFLNDLNTGGGGGVPSDYEEVKAQVAQNTSDIARLSTDLEEAVNNFNESSSEIDTALEEVNNAVETVNQMGDRVTNVENSITEINGNIQEINTTINEILDGAVIDAGGAFQDDSNGIEVMALRSAVTYTEDEAVYSIVDNPSAENEFATLDEVAEKLSHTNNFTDVVININSSKDITVKGNTVLNGYGFRNLTINFSQKTTIDSALLIKNFNKVKIYSNSKSLFFRPYTAGVEDVITIADCRKVEFDSFIINAAAVDKSYANIKVIGCDSVYMNKVKFNKGDNCISIKDAKVIKADSLTNISSKALSLDVVILTKSSYDNLVNMASISNYLVFSE